VAHHLNYENSCKNRVVKLNRAYGHIFNINNIFLFRESWHVEFGTDFFDPEDLMVINHPINYRSFFFSLLYHIMGYCSYIYIYAHLCQKLWDICLRHILERVRRTGRKEERVNSVCMTMACRKMENRWKKMTGYEESSDSDMFCSIYLYMIYRYFLVIIFPPSISLFVEDNFLITRKVYACSLYIYM